MAAQTEQKVAMVVAEKPTQFLARQLAMPVVVVAAVTMGVQLELQQKAAATVA
jgi:hypothetical protein